MESSVFSLIKAIILLSFDILFFIVKKTFSLLRFIVKICLQAAKEPSAENDQQDHNVQRYQSEECSICLEKYSFPLLSTCGHAFCGKCILGQWEKKPEEQITCPLCRRQMSILIKDFKVPSNANADPTLKKVLEGVRKYNDKFSGKPRTKAEEMLDARFLLGLLGSFVGNREGIIFILKKIVTNPAIIGYLTYIISPLDLIPDVIPIIGLSDDLVAGAFLLTKISSIYYNYLRSA